MEVKHKYQEKKAANNDTTKTVKSSKYNQASDKRPNRAAKANWVRRLGLLTAPLL